MMNFKTVICAAAVTLAAFVNTGLADCSTCKAGKKNIGLQLYSLRDDVKKDYAATIKKAAEMGYTEIEAAGYSNGKFYGLTPEEFKKSIEDVGMKVVSSHAALQLTPKQLETKDFSEALKWWDEAIAAHKAAGMTYIGFPWTKKPAKIKDLQTFCEYLNAIGKKCADAGITFCYHNHAFEFDKVEDKVMYDYMLAHTDPKYVSFEMDVYWVVRGQQSPVEYFEKNPGRFKLLHIKDHKELGQSGMVGFDAIFNNMEKSGAQHFFVEVERYNFAPEVSVKKSADYLLNAPFVK